MKKSLAFLVSLSAALAVQAALPPIPSGKAPKTAAAETSEVREFTPVIDGSSIVFGNKKVELSQNGVIKVIADGVMIAEIMVSCSVDDLKNKKTLWGGFDPASSTLKRDGSKFVWDLKKKVGKEVWKTADQTLAILPDNRLQLDVRLRQPPNPDFKLRGTRGVQWIFLPFDYAEGASHAFNGKSYIPDASGKQRIPAFADSSRIKQMKHVYYSGNPAREFKVETTAATCYVCSSTAYPTLKKFRYDFVMQNPADWKGTLILDLRKGVRAAASPDIRGGINFRLLEKMELPDSAGRNLLPNPSFERGLEGYQILHTDCRMKWDWKPYFLQSDEVHSGRYALQLDALKDKAFWGDDYRRLRCTVNLTPHTVILDPGTYTYSLYAKGEKGCKTRLNIWIPNFKDGSSFAAPGKEMIGEFDLTPEWKRYSLTFTLKEGRPGVLNINASNSTRESCRVWIDDLQLEKGSKPTPFAPPPAEGRLLTSEPENFVSADRPVNGRMQITAAKPGISGEALIQVKNFFGEILLRKSFPFKTDAKGCAEISLPLDELPGLGIFVVRADYTLADGSKAYEHHRYTRMKYLNNTHPRKNIFSYDYSPTELHYNFLDVLARWKKLGVGAKHYASKNPEVFAAMRKYGIEPTFVSMVSYIRDWGMTHPSGFCILGSEDIVADNINGIRLKADDPRILIRDFRLDGNGRITPEYLAKFRQAVCTKAKNYSHIKQWLWGGEFIAHFPGDWWGKNLTPRDKARMHAQLLKAFAAGVKDADPKAQVLQDAPCNMSPEGGIAETDLLLQECGKLGLKFDIIAIHPYRFSPEAPDLDADTVTFFKMLEKNGYDKDKVTVLWSEMMHWGPFDFPSWNVKASSWGSQRWFGYLLSYDMGWTEKRTAAWFMRSFLVGLKFNVPATAGCMYNNFAMDVMMTPYASQLAANTLGNLLGDSVFKADIRFAPFIRAYVFEDAKKRPVAAVWCHLDKVDWGSIDAPVAEADFGDTLESVFDMTNSPRAFTPGKVKFAVTGFPLFFRGKPGTLKQMTAALSQAQIVSGEGISTVQVAVRPAGPEQARADLKNFISAPFKGTLNGKRIEVPGSGARSVLLPLPEKLTDSRIAAEKFDLTLRSDAGAAFSYRQSFDSFLVRHVPDSADFKTVDWNKIPAVKLTRSTGKTAISGDFRLGWNVAGFFLQVRVKDSKFVHVEYPETRLRWNNDCVQLYIDTLADARFKGKGYDENDYDYAIYPNAKGDSAIVFRHHSVEAQLGLGTQAPRDNTVAKDIPCSFSSRNGVLTYRVFIPAKYLLPLRMEKGLPFGFGLYVPDAVAPGKLAGALTLAEDGKGCFNRPHLWPLALLAE